MPREAGIAAFRAAVLGHYAREGRAFPWRETRDPWAIVVSEFMLQQTQTARVIPKYLAWLERWPGPAELAAAQLKAVLAQWSGLGYNRRAVALRATARLLGASRSGRVPDSEAELRELPGVGVYTARAVLAFAFDRPVALLETNIRAALLHWFYPGLEGVRDRELEALATLVLDREDPRTWYYALMDYGAALKRLVSNPSRRSAQHTRQSRFEGSLRQARGAALRRLAAEGELDVEAIARAEAIEPDRMRAALAALAAEGLVRYSDGKARIAED